MNKATFNQILDVNTEFYKSVANSFSDTRQYPWKGWHKLLEELHKIKLENPRILDIGCGNGRFYEFLKASNFPCVYHGIDNNKRLLQIAKQNSPDQNFELHDAITELENITGKFNLITLFGITHHIPDSAFRKKWFENILNLCDKSCLIVFTFWDFLSIEKYTLIDKAILENKGINVDELEPNDHFLGWDKQNDVVRYAHHFAEQELLTIKQIFLEKGFTVLSEYKEDGRTSRLNHYLLLYRP